MSSNIITAYTQTLYQIALKNALLSQIHIDIDSLLTIYNHNIGFKRFVNNPTLTNTYKQQLLHTTLKPYLHNKTLSFLCFIIKKGRYAYLKSICEAFITQYKKHNKIQIAHVTTPKQINPPLKHQLSALATKLTGYTSIELIEHTNPSLLGGYVLQIDDRQIDASLATQLKRLKHLVINQS